MSSGQSPTWYVNEGVNQSGKCQSEEVRIYVARNEGFVSESQSAPLINQTDRTEPFLIVIITYKLLKRHSKAKHRAPAYSRALRQIRGVVQRIVRGRLRSGC